MKDYFKKKEKAEKLIKEDKYIDALDAYFELFRINPNDNEVLNKISFLYQRITEGNYDFQPTTSKEYLMRAIAKLNIGNKDDINDCIEDLKKSVELNPKNDEAYKVYAFVNLSLNRIDVAIENIKMAININPIGEYYDNLACFIAYKNPNSQESLEYHKKAVELSPETELYWYNYGVQLAEMRQLKDSLNALNKAIELWPQYEDAIVNRKELIKFMSAKGLK